jgi:hypothetical protein
MHLATLIRPMSSLRSSPSILALPTTVGDLHLADQHFQRHSRSAAAVRQFAAPTQSETGAVPTDRCIRLHNRQRLDGILHQRYRPTKIRRSVTLKAISRLVPSLNVKLMAKDQDLSFQRQPRPEQ